MLRYIINLILVINIVAGCRPNSVITGNGRNIASDTIFAAYQHKYADGFAVEHIELKRDHVFEFTSATDRQRSFSFGDWKIIGDTLLLNSSYQQDDIPFSIKRLEEENADSLTIGWVKNLRGDVIKDAVVFINSDTVSSCMPAFDECRFKGKKVSSLKLVINNCSTKWKELKDAGNGILEPVIGVEFVLENFIFLTNKKFLIRKNRLYDLLEVTPGDRKGASISRSGFFYTRLSGKEELKSD